MEARRQLTIRQVLQVMLDVLTGGSVFRSHDDQIQLSGFWMGTNSLHPFKTNLD
jgi:hypothetical protein